MNTIWENKVYDGGDKIAEGNHIFFKLRIFSWINFDTWVGEEGAILKKELIIAIAAANSEIN